MVDEPRLTPQRIAGSARPVPTLKQGQPGANFRAVPTVRPTGLEAQAQAFGVQAQSLAVASDVLGARTDEIIGTIQETQKIEAERMYAESALALEQRMRELKKNIDPETNNFPEIALQEYDAFIKAQLGKEGLSSFQKEILSNRYAGQRFNVGQNAIAFQADIETQMAELDFERYTEAQLNRMINDPNKAEQIFNETFQYLQSANFSTLDKEKMERTLDESFSSAFVSGLIANGKLGDAEATLKSETFINKLDPNSFAALKKDLSAAKKSAAAEAEQRKAQVKKDELAVLDLQVSRGQVSYEQLNSMLESNKLTQTEHTKFTKQLDDKNKDVIDAANSATLIFEKMNNGEPLSGQDQRDFDRVYEQIFLPSTAGDSEEAQTIKKAKFITDAGLMPKAEKDFIEAALINGDATSKLQAVDLVKRIELANPFFDIGLSAEKEGLIDRLDNARASNASIEDALTEVEQDLRNPARTKQFEEEFEKQFDFNKMADEIVNQIDARFFGEPTLLSETGQRSAVVAEAKTIALQYFKTNPDFFAAVKAGAKEVAKNWAEVPSPGGKRIAMKYAPQTRYPAFDGSHDWINSQLIEALDNEGFKRDDAFLVSDPLTEREVSTGVPPAYSVYILEDDQIKLVPGLRFLPDPGEQQQKEIEAAKKKRNKRKALARQLDVGSVKEGF